MENKKGKRPLKFHSFLGVPKGTLPRGWKKVETKK